MDDRNNQLDALFVAYRDACPDPEPSASFMPGLWQRIEGRRSFAFGLGRLTRGFLAAAFALCVMMSTALVLPDNSSTTANESYLELLSESHTTTDEATLAGWTQAEIPENLH